MNVRTLTLHNPDQISLFLFRTRQLRQLTKLQSIHFNEIEESQVNAFFKEIDLNHLRTVSINVLNHNDQRGKTTANILSNIVQQIKACRIFQIEWPSNCSIECLICYGDIGLEKLIEIYSCSPRLHRLIIKRTFSYLKNHRHLTFSFPRLTSLIIEQMNVEIAQLEAFLLLTPSLIYLKLLGDCEIFNGKRWEDFLQENLPHLNQFQFDICCRKFRQQTRRELELFIQSYRSAFWLELKKWFVMIEFDPQGSYSYRISSLPICRYSYKYDCESKRDFLSTSAEISPTKNISELKLQIASFLYENLLLSNNSSLPNLTKLHLYFRERIPSRSFQYLQEKFDLSQLIQINIECREFRRGDEHFYYHFLRFLQRSDKLTSFTLRIHNEESKIYPYVTMLISLLPRRMKFLKIPINETKQIPILLKRCPNLSIVKYSVKTFEQQFQMQQCFERCMSRSISKTLNRSQSIPIENKNEEEEDIRSTKRMKTIDE